MFFDKSMYFKLYTFLRPYNIVIGLKTITSVTFTKDPYNIAAYAPAEVPVNMTLLYFASLVFK